MMRPMPALLRTLVRNVLQHRLSDHAAQFAFYSLLSIFPFLIFLLSIMAFIPVPGMEDEVRQWVQDVMPEQAAALVNRTVGEIFGRERRTLLALSLAGALWSASAAMNTTTVALNKVFACEDRRPWWRRRLLGLAMTLVAAATIVVSTFSIMIGPGLIRQAAELFGWHPSVHLVWRWLRIPVAVVAMMFTLSCGYFVLPAGRPRFRPVTWGAAVAVMLWIGVAFGFNHYVRHVDLYTRTYGAVGTPIVLLLWLYLSGFVTLLGAELNALLARPQAPAPRDEPH